MCRNANLEAGTVILLYTHVPTIILFLFFSFLIFAISFIVNYNDLFSSLNIIFLRFIHMFMYKLCFLVTVYKIKLGIIVYSLSVGFWVVSIFDMLNHAVTNILVHFVYIRMSFFVVNGRSH